MGVPAAGHIFRESNVACTKYLLGAIGGSDLNLAGEMDDQTAFGQRMEINVSGTVKLLDPALGQVGQ